MQKATKTINLEKAKEKGWTVFVTNYFGEEFKTLSPPVDSDPHINSWAALYLPDTQGIMYPHWTDPEILEDADV